MTHRLSGAIGAGLALGAVVLANGCRMPEPEMLAPVAALVWLAFAVGACIFGNERAA